MDKDTLRNQYKKIRQKLVAQDKARLDQAILDNFLSSAAYKNSRHIMTFISFSTEVDTHRLIQASLEDKKHVYVPITRVATAQLEVSRLRSMDQLEPGPYNILSPSLESIDLVDPARLDLILLPGLAYDRYGTRLGYGGGYYDRFLAQNNIEALTMGIFYSGQEANFLPLEEYDIPVKTILTEIALQDAEIPSSGKIFY